MVNAVDTSKLISTSAHYDLRGAFVVDQKKIRRTIEARGAGTGFVCTIFFVPDRWDLTLSSGVAAFLEKVAGSFGVAVEALGSGSAWGLPVGFAVVVAGI